MGKEIRKPRSYKITDKAYIKAMKALQKKNRKLATVLEGFVTMVGEGAYVPHYDNEVIKSSKK